MGHSFRMTADQHAELVLEGEPSCCQVLPMAPACREPELGQGTWLVLLFAAWSGPDRRAIPVALSVVKHFGGRVRLGIRKFSAHDEIRRWGPDVKEKWGSPIWLLLRQGELVAEFVGMRPAEELIGAVQQCLVRHGPDPQDPVP